GDQPVVAHDPQVSGRDLDAELLGGRRVAGEQVGALGQRYPVDRDLTAGGAAGHAVARQADHALDVDGGVVGDAHEPLELVDRPGEDVGAGGRVGEVPGAGAVEHDDVAAVDRPQVIDDLVDQHPVADLEGVLHRGGRDVERLDGERLDDQREHERHDDEHRQLAPEAAPLAALAAAAPAAGGALGSGAPGTVAVPVGTVSSGTVSSGTVS